MKRQLEPLDKEQKIFFNALLETLNKELSILPDKPCEAPENTLYTLWHFANKKPLSSLAAAKTPLTTLAPKGQKLLQSLVTKRLQGTPLAYIAGRQNFMGLELLSNESALIPRKETELLAETCLEHVAEAIKTNGNATVLDLFTGSGNLPLCFKDRFPRAEVYGSDLSEKAIELARKNAEFLGLSVIFKISDMFSAFPAEEFTSSFDIISGAPPYISSTKVDKMDEEIAQYEPSLAFEAGPFGIKFFTQMIKHSPLLLKPHGKLIFEVGLGQGEGIAQRLRKNKNYDNVRMIQDIKGDIRVLEAHRIA